MHLKSLTLKGFKSFADRSTFTVEPGVTCIVGPNGSGKSNITDAILWVLGEQSAKSLRGATMEDVIFSGSSARRGVGVAEVDIVLDNSDHVVPLEFEEITFTRRMYRSGESEYLINKAPARLMDIVDLLHDSGLGREAHSIISQGRIDEVLKSRPEDRRALIEEVAGTLKHKKRKEKALRRLTTLDAHLDRARDIIAEIDRQLRPMQRQAARAQRYQSGTGALRDLEVSLAVDDLRKLQDGWERVLKQEKEAEATIDLVAYQAETQKADLENYQKLLEEKGLFAGDLSEQRRMASTTIQRLAGIVALIGEKDKNILSKLEELATRVDDANARIDSARAQAEELCAARSETAGQLKALYARLAELRRESETLKKARTALDEKLGKARSALHTAQAKADRAIVSRGAAASHIASLETQESMLVERLSTLESTLGSGSNTLRERRAKLGDLEKTMDRVKREMVLAESDINKRTRVVETRKAAFDRLREEYTGARAELKGLEDLDATMQTASPGNVEFLQNVARHKAFQGVVSEVIDVDPKIEGIVEQLLGADLNGVFVSDVASARGFVKAARAIDGCDVALVPLTGTNATRAPSTVGTPLIDFISADERFGDALAALLGDTYLVDSLDEAVRAFGKNPGACYVTREGVTLWPTGKITVGATQTSREGLLFRSRRIIELRERVPRLEEETAHAENELAVAEEALLSAQHDAFEVGQRLAEITGERASMVTDVARSEQEHQALVNEQATLNARAAQLERELTTARIEIVSFDEKIAKHQESASANAEAIRKIEIDRDSRFAEETRLLGLLNECQVELAQVAERESYMKRTHSQAASEAQRLEKILANAAPVRREIETMRERIEPLRVQCAALLEKAQHLSSALSDRARFEQTDSVSLRDTIHNAQTTLAETQERLTQAREELSEVKVDKAQLDVRVNAAVRAIVDDHGVPLEVALELPPLDDRQVVEAETMALRKKLSRLGAVNPIAAQEYERLKTRRDFMAAQMDDLTEARRALGRVIGAIDKKMRERFLETFEEVDRHFQDVFQILFPGGSAQLILTDPDDIDNSGIEYIVQPRGKKVRKMSLLSGGENSLSALALLFAINRVRPCPFFVLDEVEAALDDSNLRRFISFINSMRDSTQFLIVTHQRRTMEMADVLYGVSMQSDGVSKLVSQRLEGALELVGEDLIT